MPFSDVNCINLDLIKPKGALDLIIDNCTPFLRAALLTDGTLTTLLSCLLGEQIIAKTLHTNPWVFENPEYLFQSSIDKSIDEPINHHSKKNTQILERRSATLFLNKTKQPIVIAHSILAPQLLPNHFSILLSNTPAGLGQALRTAKIEHFRDIFWYGLIPKSTILSHSTQPYIPENITHLPIRIYGLFIERTLVMTIAECFVHPLFLYNNLD